MFSSPLIVPHNFLHLSIFSLLASASLKLFPCRASGSTEKTRKVISIARMHFIPSWLLCRMFFHHICRTQFAVLKRGRSSTVRTSWWKSHILIQMCSPDFCVSTQVFSEKRQAKANTQDTFGQTEWIICFTRWFSGKHGWREGQQGSWVLTWSIWCFVCQRRREMIPWVPGVLYYPM